jgi:hypothetical protein
LRHAALFQPLLKANHRLGKVAVDRGLTAVPMSDVDRPMLTHSEFLDEPKFGGEPMKT